MFRRRRGDRRGVDDRDYAHFRRIGVERLSRFDPFHPHRRARTGQYRLVQDPKRLCLGADVGRADPAGLCGAGHCDRRSRRCAGLAMAQRGALSAQSGGAVPRHDSRHALQLRLRHDGAGAGDRVFGRRRFRSRIWAVGEDFARGALAGAIDRPQRRACESGSARRAGDARYVRADIAAQRSFCRADGVLRRFS